MGRVIPGWSQSELAEIAGLTQPTIAGFEKGAGNPSARTIKKIASALEDAGVHFTENGGVEPRQDLVRTLEGPDANHRLLDDIYNTLKETGGEVLIAGLSEIDESAGEAYEFLLYHIERLQEAGLSEKILVSEEETNVVAPAHWYRQLPKDQFSNTPFQLYGNRLAMIHWGPPQKIILIEQPDIAKTFRSLFNFAWDQASPVNAGGIS